MSALIAAVIFEAVFAVRLSLAPAVRWSGSVSPGAAAAGSGDPQTPLSTPQASWAAQGMGDDPWDDGADSPTPAGHAYLIYAPNPSSRTF